MFNINDDLSIYATRGDVVFFSVTAEVKESGDAYEFKRGDVVRIKVFKKKDCTEVVLQKDFPVTEATERVDILLTEQDTKIGGVISKPVDYWYEVELNPFTDPQTIIGYDDDGAKVFKLFPEGRDLIDDVEEEDIPIVDEELSLTSERPVQNQAVTRELVRLDESVKNTENKISAEVGEATKEVNDALKNLALGGYIKSLEEQNAKELFSFWIGTQEEYNAIEVKDKNRLYIITDEEFIFDGSESTEEILARILTRLDENSTSVSQLTTKLDNEITRIEGKVDTKITNKNISTFDKLWQIGLADASMSADSLVANITAISGAIVPPMVDSDSAAFLFSCYASTSKDPNLHASIIKQIKNDAGVDYGTNQVRIEIRGTGQHDIGTKNVVITVDHGNTASIYEGVFNRAKNDKNYTLSKLVETSPSHFDKHLASGLQAKAGKSISNMAEIENYSLVAFRVKDGNNTEWGHIIAYKPKGDLGGSFYNAGDGVWRVTAQYDESSKKLTIYSVSKNGSSANAYVSDIFGVM